MEKEILEEINRMKVLGGILNEAPNPTSIIPSLLAKITKTSLDDAILRAFEVLEQRGVVTLDKAAKTLTKIDWIKLTDNELKLLFSAKPLRDALEEVTRKVGVDITSAPQRMTFKGNFKRIVKGYDDAANSIISGGGSRTGSNVSPKSWKDRLNGILSSRNSASSAGRYVPTPEDFMDVENLVIAANPGMSSSKISKIVDESRRITSAKTQEQFNALADAIITKMSSNFDKPKEVIGAKLWRLIRNNPKTSIAALVLFAPTITAGLSNKALDQFNTFLREFSPKFGGMLDTMGVSDPRTKIAEPQKPDNTETPNSGVGSKYN